jgi:hypothetical protein
MGPPGSIESHFLNPVNKQAESGSRNGFSAGTISQMNIADNDEHLSTLLSISEP